MYLYIFIFIFYIYIYIYILYIYLYIYFIYNPIENADMSNEKGKPRLKLMVFYLIFGI